MGRWMLGCCNECINLTPRYRGGLYHLFKIGVFFTFFKVQNYAISVKLINHKVTPWFQHESWHAEMTHWAHQKYKIYLGIFSFLEAVLPDILPFLNKR